MKDVQIELKKCPIFAGAREGFCLQEDCKYFSFEGLCDYERIRALRQVSQSDDRKELEGAILKRVKKVRI